MSRDYAGGIRATSSDGTTVGARTWMSKVGADGYPYGKSHLVDDAGVPVCTVLKRVVTVTGQEERMLAPFVCTFGPEVECARRCAFCQRIEATSANADADRR